VTLGNHECNKRFCQNCNVNKEADHLCYLRPLKNVLPAGDRVLYFFYDFETTQNTGYADVANLHVPNVVYVQQFCSRCEEAGDIKRDCVQSSVSRHSLWDDPVETGYLICGKSAPGSTRSSP